MSITSLRPISRTGAHPILRTDLPADLGQNFGMHLLHTGAISAHDLLTALTAQRETKGYLHEYLIASGALTAPSCYAALADFWSVGVADLNCSPPDARLLAHVDAAVCLQNAWVPWRKLGETTVIACANPDDFGALRPQLTPHFGPLIMAVAPREMIEKALLLQAGPTLARRAEMRVPAADSCRNYSPRALYVPLFILAFSALLAVYFAPKALFLAALAGALTVSYALTALKLLAILPRKPATVQYIPHAHLRLVPPLPTISIMVALYRESRIVARLIRRLENLNYPRALLDVIFVIEDNDHDTAEVLASLNLPSWLRVLPVPTGTIRTKPRALNYGLDHCRGSIIGIYDAEDAPAADQLCQVAQRFAQTDDRLACLQGRLDYYNPHTNWLARCFTIEYAAWWRVFLPGIERLGLAIPLGGTTLFFRRNALMDLGGWDAHNVTEDADLGLRIARRGYRTELIDTVTMEEANCRALPWIKQRSRWIKGYMITYATHMRDPVLLWRQLGARRFWGVQVMFAGSILQALFAPLLWALWLVPFGLFDTALGMVPQPVLMTLAVTGVLTEALMMGCNYAGVLQTGHKINARWLPLMMLYNMMATVAAYKALWEMLAAPFYWDKTSHGLFDTKH